MWFTIYENTLLHYIGWKWLLVTENKKLAYSSKHKCSPVTPQVQLNLGYRTREPFDLALEQFLKFTWGVNPTDKIQGLLPLWYAEITLVWIQTALVLSTSKFIRLLWLNVWRLYFPSLQLCLWNGLCRQTVVNRQFHTTWRRDLASAPAITVLFDSVNHKLCREISFAPKLRRSIRAQTLTV